MKGSSGASADVGWGQHACLPALHWELCWLWMVDEGQTLHGCHIITILIIDKIMLFSTLEQVHCAAHVECMPGYFSIFSIHQTLDMDYRIFSLEM